MAQLTISAAARLCHMDRRTLQRAIHADRLHLDAHHCLSTDELILAGYLITDTPQETPQVTPQYAPQETPHITPQEMPLLPLLERLALAMEGLVDEVRQLREDLRQTPQAAPQRVRRTRAPTPQSPPQVTSQGAPQDAPQTSGAYDPRAAVARMQTLRLQGLSLAQIAGRLTAEGMPTRSGKPWQKGTVDYLLKTYG
jgi:hypothetical protein